MSALVKLDDYQLELIERAKAELARLQAPARRRCLMILPTGGGKTVVASEVIRRAVEKDARILFLAHRRELILQTAAKLKAFGVEPGIIMGSEPRALQRLVQVASVQTLARNRDLLQHVDIIFLDEAHHAAAEQYEEILSWYPNAVVLGLTATPWRMDGRGLADVFDTHAMVRTPKQLKEEGWLVPVGGWEFESIDTTKARVQGGDFAAKDLAAEAVKPRVVGNIVEEWLRRAGGGRTVVFCVSVETSKVLVAKFREAGVSAEHVDGEMHKLERDAVLARLKSGATRVVCNCNVLTEGFDCPALEVCVLARPTLSTSLYLQMVGRVLRTVCFDCGARNRWTNERCTACGSANLKRRARIHDHAGCLAAHLHPYRERDYSPTTSTRASRKDMEDLELATVNRKLCRSCKSVRVGYPCDNCGYAPTPRELKVEFEEEARAKAILEEGALEAVRDQQAEKAARFANVPERGRRAFFDKVLSSTRSVKAARVAFWKWSGETEWPPHEWSSPPAEASP
jgi:DNA repair protein RadD